MEACSPEIYKAFEKVNTRNQSPEKKDVWFDFQDGYDTETPIGKERVLFTLKNSYGAVSYTHLTLPTKRIV